MSEVITAYKNHLKIREIQPHNVDSIKMTIARISHILGVKTAPAKEIIDMLTALIQKEYGDMTLKEIPLAFQKAVTGKLDVNAETYQNFTIPYVCKILNAYRLFRNNELRMAASEPVETGESITPEDAYTLIIEYLNKHDKIPQIAPWLKAFDYAYFNGIITIDPAEQDEFKKKVEDKLKIELNRSIANGNQFQREMIKKQMEGDGLRTACKIAYIKDYFNGLQNN